MRRAVVIIVAIESVQWLLHYSVVMRIAREGGGPFGHQGEKQEHEADGSRGADHVKAAGPGLNARAGWGGIVFVIASVTDWIRVIILSDCIRVITCMIAFVAIFM